ncbi:hypothetical protein GW17_00051275, partial [Ensete ventricosum]
DFFCLTAQWEFTPPLISKHSMPKRPAVTKHYLPLHSFPFPTCTTDVSLPASWLDGVMVRHAGPAGGMALISSKVGG